MARQRLGQHFLVQGSVLERIARAACPVAQPLVIEIGPGRGALTARLLEHAARVVAIEIDHSLADHLRHRFAADHRLEVVEADVLSTDLAQWGPAPIAGNLPYYITSPILERALRLRPPRAVFLLQKEVAHRLLAQPGSRDYGYLTVATALFAAPRLLCEVRPSAFRPPPKVDSAAVEFAPRPPAVPDAEAFLEFVARCFRHKRKTIRNNLAVVYGKDVIESWPEAALRAEQLSLPQLAEMWRRLRP
ncbi:MAG TPA: 16S rRNA (adenine(1518)-N(6)/adenine(1519)-N(6))-dimethyltransferase RsmA [Bryobacteraceae bacterium]